MDQQLQIGITEQGGIALIEVIGRVDANTSFELESNLIQVVNKGVNKIILKTSHMAYISSSGLRVLLASLKKVKQNGGDLILVDLQASPKEVMKMTGFDRLFRIFATNEEALALFTA